MKSSVYLESSVISCLAAQKAISHEWWNNDRQRFDLRISALVEEEITIGDEDAAKRRQDLVAGIPSLAISDEAIELAELLLSEGVIPKGSENDALHVGIAAAQGADFLLTWNFRHINNAEMKSAIAQVVESRGFACPQICSREELGGESND